MFKPKAFSWFFFFFSIASFLVGATVKLDVPLTDWDRVALIAAENWARGINYSWQFDHPPLYPAFLALVFHIFGFIIRITKRHNLGEED
ncbi:MAG: hypothetical protein A3G93_04690 [Nitrospinae bacterium RIFCSPLOWO2_12_FULL_45_22]|nr:MAG: hypothetical protein A3G93_04690 [Nitrospinae bacterium RIFCSPLOWO2_12_FULL_45_22]